MLFRGLQANGGLELHSVGVGFRVEGLWDSFGIQRLRAGTCPGCRVLLASAAPSRLAAQNPEPHKALAPQPATLKSKAVESSFLYTGI